MYRFKGYRTNSLRAYKSACQFGHLPAGFETVEWSFDNDDNDVDPPRQRS